MNKNCRFVTSTGIQPFGRCRYCEKMILDCFGFQFFIISIMIVGLLITTFLISDLPVIALDILILMVMLIGLLSYIASKESNEITLSNLLLEKLNKDLESRVDQRTLELENTNRELIKVDQMKNEFIGIINHELKTPITSIISGIEVIRAHGIEKFDDSQKKLIEIMWNSTLDMLKLTNNLLDVSKIESGKIEIYPEHIPAINVLEETLQALRPEAERKKVVLVSKIEDKVVHLFADPYRLKQILFNLIDNAIKYTDENGSVTISMSQEGSMHKIEVNDSGIGIKPDKLSSLFSKFSKHVPGYKGTGLGLFITKSFVEAHNGRVDVYSIPGKGTAFSVFLPRM